MSNHLGYNYASLVGTEIRRQRDEVEQMLNLPPDPHEMGSPRRDDAARFVLRTTAEVLSAASEALRTIQGHDESSPRVRGIVDAFKRLRSEIPMLRLYK